MRRIVTGWQDTAKTLTELADEVAAAAAKGTGLAIGKTAVAVEQSMSEHERVLRDMAEYAQSLADQVANGARHIEFQQLTVDLTMWAVALQVGYAVLFPHGAVLTLAARMWAQQTFRTSLARMLTRLLLEGAEYVAKRPVLAVPLQGGVSGAVEGGTTDALAQRIQIRDDHREVVDTRSVLVSTAAGTAGGIAGDAGARWLTPGVARMTQPLPRVAGVPVARPLQVATLGAAGGFFGAPAGMVVAVVAAGGDPREVTAQEWGEGLITGMGGGIIGAAGYALRSTAAPLPVPSLEPIRVPNEPGRAAEWLTGADASNSLEVPSVDDRSTISAPPETSVSAPPPAETPAPVTLWPNSGGEYPGGVPQQSRTDPPDTIRTGPSDAEPVATAGRAGDQVPADTAPQIPAPDQPADQLPGNAPPPAESVPVQPEPGSDATGAEPGPRAEFPWSDSEYAAREANTVDTPHTERAATATGPAADIPTPSERFRSIPSEAAPERELSGNQSSEGSPAPEGRNRFEPVVSDTPAQEAPSVLLHGVAPPSVPGGVSETPAPRPAASSTGGAGKTPARSPGSTAETRAPEPAQTTHTGDGSGESRPQVIAPRDSLRGAGTATPGRSGVTAPDDHAGPPSLPDPRTASAQNTPEAGAVAATATPPQTSHPAGPIENQASTAPESRQSAHPRVDPGATRSDADTPPGPAHRAEAPSSSPAPDPTAPPRTELDGIHAAEAAEPVRPEPADTPHDRPYEPDRAMAPDSPFELAPYALDISTHQTLNRRREELLEAADATLLETERTLQTMWSTATLERQLAEVSDPALRASGLEHRLNALRNKGISPQRIAELDTAVHRAVAAHHEVTAAVRTDAQRMQHILRAYADAPASPPTWRDPHSTAPEPPCGPATLVALQALYPDTHRHVPDVVGIPEPSRPTPWSTDATAWSYLLGNRAEPVGSGAAAHRRTVEMLAGPHGEVPIPGRGAGAVRRAMVIVDAYSTDHRSSRAHTYLAAKLNSGELVRLDLSGDPGPRPLGAPGGEVVHRKVYALDSHGRALAPAPTGHLPTRTPSPAGKAPSGDSAVPGGTPTPRHRGDAAGIHHRAPRAETTETASAARVEPPTARINEPAPTTHVEPSPATHPEKPASTDTEPAAATRANEPAPTTRVEPVSTSDREFEFGPRIGELEPGTHVDAVPVGSDRRGLRGWLLRMATSPVGVLMSGSLAASLGTTVAGMSASMSVGMLTNSPGLASMVLTARNLANFLTTLPAGFAADRFDQRRVARTSTFVGLGAAATGLVAMLSSGFLAPVAVAGTVAVAIFVTTGADSFTRAGQARLAERYAQNGPDNEQKEVGRLEILARQSSATAGSFLGPVLANLHPAVPFAVKGASSLFNLGAARKAHRDFGEPPQLGESETPRHPPAESENGPLVNETTPGTVANRPRPDTRVEPEVDNAANNGENRTERPENYEDRPHPPDVAESETERSTAARDTAEHDDQQTEPVPTDRDPEEPAVPRSWWGRARDGLTTMFGPVWQDQYLRAMTLVVAPLSGLATGMQSIRVVEFMTSMPGWQAGLLAAGSGLFGIGGALLGTLSFKKSTVKSLEPMTTTVWAATALPSAIWLNPFLIMPSMAATSVLGLAANVKMADYMHEVDTRNSGGKQIGRMRAASTLVATAGMAAGGAGGGILLAGSGLAVTGFAQVGVLAVAAIASGYYGFRHRTPRRSPGAGDSDSGS